MTAAVAAWGLKAQTQSGLAAPLQLASGLSRRVLSLQCLVQKNTDIKPIIRWGLLSVFLYAFRERKAGKKIQLLKLYHFPQLYLAQTKWFCFLLPCAASLVRETNWKSLVEILAAKANGFSHSYASVTSYFTNCYLELC